MSEPIDQQVAARAYERFLSRGGEHGHALEDWLAAEAELSPTPYDVVLAEPGPNTIELVRAIRELTNLPLAQIRTLVGSTPHTLTRVPSRLAAEPIRKALEPLGARVELKSVT